MAVQDEPSRSKVLELPPRVSVTIRVPDDDKCELVITNIGTGKADVHQLSVNARINLLIRLHESMYRHYKSQRARIVAGAPADDAS